jgi:glutathione synthase/RimK-type ligase-like ATP-grasp enzyme
MPRLALATSSKYPNLTGDDRLLLEPLSARGFEAEPAVWDDPSSSWSTCAGVVIRSCWDYHLKPERFLRWIASLEALGVPVWNSGAILRWNTNKSYLRDLEAKGVPIVPTHWSERGAPENLQEKLRELGWDKAVIKPRIAATAYRTQLVSTDDAPSAQALFDDLRGGPGVMVQRFMDGIAIEGEWSLIFFDGAFSHAIVKHPQLGDFRVQSDFGGTSHLADPPPLVLESAIRAIAAVDRTLYARVDGVIEDARFLLMELELIEPGLFLASHPAASARFADAIAGAVAPPK